MSQENVKLVLGIYASWQQGDFSKTDWAADDIEFWPMDAWPDAANGRGIEHMRNTWRSFLIEWEDVRTSAEDTIAVDEHVVVRSRFHGHGNASGVSMESMAASAVFTIRDGKVARLALYGHVRDALEAAGLSE
jgi:ketosteroid isomerase-like protein